MCIRDSAVDDTGSAEIGDLKKEMASLEIKIANLLKALEQGAISDALMERLNNYETRCKALEERIALMDRKVDTVAKSAVVAELRKDADRILADPSAMKDILQNCLLYTSSSLPSIKRPGTCAAPGRSLLLLWVSPVASGKGRAAQAPSPPLWKTNWCALFPRLPLLPDDAQPCISRQ